MGYEVKYLYHNKKEDGGGYDRESTEEIVKKIGDPFDDVPLEKLAAAILMQMARRDIWVVDVKITELKKQEIAFKESTDGIVLKNKKFTLDSIAGALESSAQVPQQVQVPQMPQAALTPQQIHEQLHAADPRTAAASAGVGAPISVNPQQPQQPQQPQMPEPAEGIPVPADLQGKVPIKAEVFDPEPDMLQAGMVKGKLTPGKKYPIFEERRDPRESTQGPLPILYITIDDNGRKAVVPEPCFRPAGGGLIGGNFQSRPHQSAAHGDGLAWDGVVGEDNQDIRAGRRRMI